MTVPVPPGVEGALRNAEMSQSAENLQHLQRLSYLRAQAQHRELTDTEQDELAEERTCIHCGGFHARACPRVRRIAFHPQSGRVAEVEYWSASEIDWTGVVFDDVPGDRSLASDHLFMGDLELITGLTRLPWFNKGMINAGYDGQHRNTVLAAARRLELLLESLRSGAVQSGDEPPV